MSVKKKVVLLILDGWGIAPKSEGNAISLAKTSTIDSLITNYPVMTLQASGPEVGLAFGEMGNSEVGHANIGAGQVFYQNFLRISKSIADGSFFKNEILLRAMAKVESKKRNFLGKKGFEGKKLHLVGIASEGGVHGHMEHLIALLKMANQAKVKEVYLHLILDGRDSVYNSGKGFIQTVEKHIQEIGIGKIATVSGRFYAMDRDNHWERVEKAFRAMVNGVSEKYYNSPVVAVEESYKKEVYDEEFLPVVIVDKNNKPVGTIDNGDSVIFFNFRADRAKELTKAFVLPEFNKFERQKSFSELNFVTLMEYERNLPVEVAFRPLILNNPLGKIIADAGLFQLRLAETEKFAHVTFFFNGLSDVVFQNEERIIISSPRVDSFADKLEMSLKQVNKELLDAISTNKYSLIVCNFANADIVGHTGNLQATIKAIEFVDKAIRDLVEVVLSLDYVLLITADHGNAEELINLQTGEIDKEHSTNPVPLIIVGKEFLGKNISAVDSIGGDLSLLTPIGVLSDIAPTILKLMGLKKSEDMTGTELI